MDDGIRAAEERHEVVGGDVGRGPLCLGDLELRQAAGDAEHRIHCGFAGELVEQARAGIARCSDDDDVHYGWRTTLIAPSSFFWKIS